MRQEAKLYLLLDSVLFELMTGTNWPGDLTEKEKEDYWEERTGGEELVNGHIRYKDDKYHPGLMEYVFMLFSELEHLFREAEVDNFNYSFEKIENYTYLVLSAKTDRAATIRELYHKAINDRREEYFPELHARLEQKAAERKAKYAAQKAEKEKGGVQ